jgi:hypothetical protein
VAKLTATSLDFESSMARRIRLNMVGSPPCRRLGDRTSLFPSG